MTGGTASGVSGGVTGGLPFRSPYRHGFARVAAAVPTMQVTDVDLNVGGTIEMIQRAHRDHVAALVLPELGLTGYTAQDLFHQETLIDAAVAGLRRVRDSTADLMPLTLVGLPMRVGHQLFNVAAVVHRGRVLGVVPKSHLPNYREFYEGRHFSAARGDWRDPSDGHREVTRAMDIARFERIHTTPEVRPALLRYGWSACLTRDRGWS